MVSVPIYVHTNASLSASPSLPLSLSLSLTDKPNLYSFVSILSAPSPPACLIDQLLLACGRRSDQHLVYVQSGCLWQAYSE